MFTFLKEAVSNLRQTGSVIESSPYLSMRMTQIIDFKRKLHILELGAGTGKTTNHLLHQMNSCSMLTAFEINTTLCKSLKSLQDRRLRIFNKDVSLLSEHIPEKSIDYIISGIPLANIAREQKLKILHACKRALKPEGYYIQFQYSLNDAPLLKQKFSSVRCGFTLLNFPPAVVYYAKN